jgi:hypothetical protein
MSESLEQLLARLSRDQTLLHAVEEATKQGAVLPILSQIGWNCINLQEVTPEFSVGNGRIDYCLNIGQKKTVFIEVKRPSEDLDKHEKQLLGYSFEDGVETAVLTNGLVWWFYLPLDGGSWQQRKFFAIDIQQQSPNIAAQHFKEFLGRSSIADGSAVSRAKAVKESREKNILIKKTIPQAWRRIVEEPNELLIELFADKVESMCGYRPELEKLSDFIQEKYISVPPSLLEDIIDKGKALTPPVSPPNKSKQKGARVVIENETIAALTVSDLYLKVLKILLDSSLIKRASPHIPYATSSVRFLISTDPHHQGGNEFRNPVEYKGYYMEAHKDYKIALSHLEAFLKTCGISIKY